MDVFDAQFNKVSLDGTVTDPDVQAGFAPFGIANLGGVLYVSYARRDAAGEDDVEGPAKGFVDLYDTNGHLLRRGAARGR